MQRFAKVGIRCSKRLKLVSSAKEYKWSYKETKRNVENVSKKMKLKYGGNMDGRVESAIKESSVKDYLKAKLIQINPEIEIEIPENKRCWYDIKIEGIPINIKITSGGTDNVMSKEGVYYSLTGESPPIHKCYSDWYKILEEHKDTIKQVRNVFTEYHYLVIHKKTGNVMFKSIFDIRKPISNSSNDLQFNWNYEFENKDFAIIDDEYGDIVVQLLSTIQKSTKDAIDRRAYFANADIESLFKL